MGRGQKVRKVSFTLTRMEQFKSRDLCGVLNSLFNHILYIKISQNWKLARKVLMTGQQNHFDPF